MSIMLGAARVLSGRAFALVASAVVLSGAGVRAQAPGSLAGPGSAPDTVPVVLTVAGAISLGAYQGGVHWGLTEFVRKTNEDESFRGAVSAAAESPGTGRVPPYAIVAAAGASAGNINSVLTALEWCRAPGASQIPEESLFWQTWIRTGWDQLFPVTDLGDWETNTALFTRRYFDQVLQPMLDSIMGSGDKRASCRVPIGITITRLRPDSVFVDSAGLVPAATQRFASVVQVASDGRRLQFREPEDSLFHDRSLGRVVRLPGAGGTDVLELSSVMDLVEASSAFPIAFAPVELAYEDPEGCRRSREKCGVLTDVFVDGGAFDNNPLDLAYGLYRHLDPTPHPDTRVIYVDVDRYRGELARTRNVAPANPAGDRGIGAVLTLLGGAVPSARQYELQALARAFARTPEGRREANWIRVTDRFFPVAGEHLGYFAAFLGRPFREYDFYVGIYDGLRFAARDLVCRGDDANDGCTARVLGELLREGHLRYGNVAPIVLDSLYRLEYGRGLRRDEPLLATPADTARAVLAAALVHANRPLLRRFDNGACASGTVAARLTCGDGLGLMLDSLSTPAVLHWTARFAGLRQCAPRHWRTSPDSGCVAETSFRDLLVDREAFAGELVDVLLHQMWRVEDRLGVDHAAGTYPARNHEALTEAMEMIYRSGPASERGFAWFPSSVPDVVSHGSRSLRYLPHLVGTNLEAGGLELGYRPTYYTGNPRLAFAFPVAFNYRPPARHSVARVPGTIPLTPGQSYIAAGASLLWKPGGLLVSGLDVGPQVLVNVSPRDRGQARLAAAAGVYLLAGKVHLGTRYIFEPSPFIQRGNSFGYTLGIADFNGLVYWALRTAFK